MLKIDNKSCACILLSGIGFVRDFDDRKIVLEKADNDLSMENKIQIMTNSLSHLTKAEDKWCGSSLQNILEIYCQLSYCQISSHFLKHSEMEGQYQRPECVCLWVRKRVKSVADGENLRDRFCLVEVRLYINTVDYNWVTLLLEPLWWCHQYFPWHHLGRIHRRSQAVWGSVVMWPD